MKIKNLIGRFKGYSGCQRCGDTWDWKKEHVTNYGDGGMGCFPLCDECWESLTRHDRLFYYKKLWNKWKDVDLREWHDIENAVMNGR